jgi:transcription elongation factor Elf1
MDIKEFTRKNADALKKTIGEKLTCPMCGHKDFTVLGGYVREDLQTQMNSFVFGSPVALSMAVVVCQHCGFVSHHDVDVLQKPEKAEDENATK